MKASRILSGAVFCLLLFTSVASANELGAWSAKPGEAGTTAYSSDLDAWSSPDLRERTSWACVDESGREITVFEREILSQVFLAAAEVYDGRWQFGGGAALSPDDKPLPLNGGYDPGPRGMQDFLRDEKRLLRTGDWTPYASRVMQTAGVERGQSYKSAASGWDISLGEGKIGRQGRVISALIPSSALTPLSLHQDLPEACGLVFLDTSQPTLQTQLLRPGDYLLDQILYVPGKITSALMEFIQPHAFSYTFWTPHTERSDLLWDIPESCSPEASDYLTSREVKEACKNGEVLGWNKENYESGGRDSWFILAAQLLQWIISGAYLLILFSAALFFILRGHKDQTLGIMRMVPRIFLSIILTLSAGAIIGAAISFSNLLVQAVFEFNDSRPLGALNTVLLQSGNIVGGPDIVQRLMELLSNGLAVFFYFVFVLSSLLRQIVLVLAVILAPLAAMTLIVPRWRHHFRTYCRVFFIVLLVPVVLALLLKVGMSINPLLLRPEEAYGTAEGFLGLLLLLLTFWTMYKAIRWSIDFARGAPAPMSIEKIQKVISGPREPLPSEASLLPEKGPLPSSQIAKSSNKVDATASLVPGGVAVSQKFSATLPSSGRPDVSTKSKFETLRNKGAEDVARVGRKRVSSSEALHWREGLLSELNAAEGRSGRKLSRNEVRSITESYAAFHGGKLKRIKGSWYLEKPTS